MDVALARMRLKATEETNDQLIEPFTIKNVLEVLAQICPTKSLGPGGLPAVFFQKHWYSVKEGVLSTCRHILNDQYTIAPLNHTYIALIPKVAKLRNIKRKKSEKLALKVDISKAYDRV